MPKALIGCRRNDPRRRPIAGAIACTCARCTVDDVMLSPATLARREQGDPVLCIDCMVAIAKERDEKWLEAPRSDAQIEELIANGYAADRFGVQR